MSTNSVYTINRGVNRPIEFKGLKGQWIGWMASGLVLLLVSFAVLYILGVPLILLVPFILLAGFALLYSVFRLSKHYGEYGLMKWSAQKRLPTAIIFRTRRAFTALVTDAKNTSHGNR